MDRRVFSLSLARLPLAASALIPAAQASEDSQRIDSAVQQALTFTQVGKQETPFLDRAEAVLAEKSGSGYLNHIWFGGTFPHYQRMRLRIYVDCEAAASIEMELGMGVGVGFEDPFAPWGTRFGGITGSPSGIFMNHAIPFGKRIRVTAELPPGAPCDSPLWWVVRGIEGLPLILSGITIPAHGRLRLHRNENLQVQPFEEVHLCDTRGSGMIYMVTIAARSSNFEFLEGQMRAYFGEEPTPQFLSSGLEDYFLGTYYFNRGLYHLHQAGLTHKNEENHSFSAYRFHDLDPIVYSEGIRLACRCGEKRGDQVFGTTGNPQPTTFTTYVWTYEW
jgi:hypothetical protein